MDDDGVHRRTVRAVLRRVSETEWVVCENRSGPIERDAIHGFVRRVGDVFETVRVTHPLIRHYVRDEHHVFDQFTHPHPFLPPLPHDLPDVPARDFTDDELGAEAGPAA
jgi:hypothetical protein